MSTEKMRQEFEAWIDSEGLRGTSSGDYRYQGIECYWKAWKASRAAIEVPLPNVAEYFDQSEYPHTCKMLERDLKSSIESLGLEVKP